MSIFRSADNEYEEALIFKRSSASSMGRRGESPKTHIDVSHLQLGASPVTSNARPLGRALTYTVVAGDTLWKIATRQLGDGRKWAKIYEANKDKIKDPDFIHPGQVFRMPHA
ncbi:MAG: LysM peptidoglycan-binding domain-containing protein [Luteitalea sp.]|nr:LysM peptidoglycan-binding domain-containing protein [Luteitalea sp.]